LTSLDGGEDAGGFPQPPGTIAVNFTVDDTANRVFTAGDGGASSLRWYGNLTFDASTRELSYDNGWSGPYPALYDDGPWIRGGHEPSSNVAGDHRWGATVFVKVPTTAAVAFEYGAVDAATNGWLWRGQNGEFTVEVGATQPITVASLTLLKFGSTDLMLVLDTNSLEPHPPAFDGGVSPWSLSSVKVKGTAWAWTQAPMEDDGGIDASPGDGKYTFVLSQVVGPGKLAPHSGLLASGDVTDFVFLLGSEEYRISGEASIQGATAFLKADGGSFSPVAISHSGGVQNPRVLVP
jgi:hypothetical protein